ncbi:MAG: alpha/beta fold hydrolase [Gammaproteobacteria bacterium]
MTSGFLNVGESHVVYWRAFGHLDAMPVIALHGGPASGSNPRHLMFFDPRRHRVVMFDQRGSGQSTSSAATTGNTTQKLVEDIGKLRCHLRIERWLVFGLSWGACLALLYGQHHPRDCTGLVLAGLSNRHDYQTSWILEQRARLLPERHAAFLSALAPADRADPVAAYYRKSLSPDRREQLEATHAVWVLEAGLEVPEPGALPTLALDEIEPGMINRAKVYLHYWANKTFLPEGHLLINPSALVELPVTMVHGAADWICPLSGAQQVADAIESVRLVVVPGVGHSPYGADMAAVLRESIVALS